MSETPDLSIIIRIEKLMRQGEDSGCTPEEREAFQQKAAELVERHRIDRSLIGGHLSEDDKIVDVAVGPFDGVYGRVRIDIVHVVANAYDCKLYWRGYGNKRTLHCYGFRSDTDIVISLGNRLLADADLRVDCMRGYDLKATLNARRGFYMGYREAVDDRLSQARRTVRETMQAEGADVQSAALVLVDRKRQVHEDYAAKHGRLRQAGGVQGAYAGHEQGRQAGSQVSLAVQNQVGGRKALGR